MGSYAVVTIGDVHLTWTKNDIDPGVMVLFTEKDKVIEDLKTPDDEDEDDESLEFLVKYAAKLAVVKDRLEFLGITLQCAQTAFVDGLSEKIAELEEMKSYGTKEPSYLAQIDEEVSVLKEMTFEIWVSCLAEIINRNLAPTSYRARKELPSDVTPQLMYMVNHSEEFYGFPSYDFRVFLRSVVEVTGTEDEIVYDLSDLVAGECIDKDDDLCTYARWQFAEDFVINHKTIVLTEGVSDSRTISAALDLLYPHLSEYYSFMDFDGARVSGSAGALVSTVKAFIGAGIVNRVVAFLDNDTAAHAAMKGLKGVLIPNNIRIFHYPDIEIARDYPTLGPQGTVNMNVNGLAGSLELYFGEDVIRDPDGTLTPVQWKGYDEGLKQYQGEILHKGQLQSRFLDKINICKADREALGQGDWTGVNAILDRLKTAFNE